MKMTGKLVDVLVNLHPEAHKDSVALEKGGRVLQAKILKAIFGIPEAALLWCWIFRKDLRECGFIFIN